MKKRYFLAIGIAAVFIAGAGGFLIGQNIYLNDRWYPGTDINGYTVSAKTMEDSIDNLKEHYEGYKLEITGRDDGRMTIAGSSIGYGMEWDEKLEDIFDKQHDSVWLPFRVSDKIDVEPAVSYDEGLLEKIINGSELVCGSGSYKISAPESAYIKYDEEKGIYVCVEEKAGNKIVLPRLMEIVKDALGRGETEIDLTDESKFSGVYESPEVAGSDASLKEELSARNNAAIRFITWNMGGGVTETVDAGRISDWIEYAGGAVKYDKKAIKAWTRKMCDKYDTLGKPRSIKSHNGKKITVYGGDYGWQLDYGKTYGQLMGALKKKIGADKTSQYAETQGKPQKKAVTIKLKPVYLNSAYKLSTGEKVKDWDEDNYIEVSLGEQMVYVFRKGKVAFSCKCISGLPGGERQTATGTYYIKEHRRDYTMVGEDYETFVKCWVRITWTGIGFHPATWQPWGSWSRNLYKYRGSHGCINLTPSDAETIYDMSRYKEAVFIHG